MVQSSADLGPELLTVAEMYTADRLTIAGGVPGRDLMAAAGGAVADAILADGWGGGTVLVLCGPGNNGGDGFVIARRLQDAAVPVRLALLGDRRALKGDAADAASAWDGEVEALNPDHLAGVSLVVDALFGAGLDRALTGTAAAMVRAVTRAGLPVVAVDVPSGIVGDQAEPLEGVAFRARQTITFFRKKPAHLLVPARLFCGKVRAVDIGIPATVLQEIAPRCYENIPSLWADVFPWRQPESHKYQAGHVLVAGGDPMTGAAQLASRAALRIGAGLVTVACTRNSLAIYALANPSVITLPLDDSGAFAAALGDSRRNVALLGPGNGATEETRERVVQALQADCHVVLDADALSVFQNRAGELCRLITASNGRTVLTPHDGEFSRLFPELGGNRLQRARAAAAMSGATVVLKGPDTVVAAPDGRAAINGSAPPWLATAGTGDVLAGMLAGLLAQGMPSFAAASAGVWIHGKVARDLGPGMISEDLSDALPAALKRLYQRRFGPV